MYLITAEDYSDLSTVFVQLRTVFANVFAQCYTAIIKQALLKGDQQTLAGFADLEAKYFPKTYANTPAQDMKKIFYDLYFGGGFDDEVAALRAFTHYNPTACTPEQHLAQQKLSAADRAEMESYLAQLNREGRKLKAVGFVAMMNEQHQMHGFVVYHRMTLAGKDILHIRQAACMTKGMGRAAQVAQYYHQRMGEHAHFISSVAKLLIQRYPKSYYEANQRSGNKVPVKERASLLNLLRQSTAVIGYPEQYYFSYHSESNCLTTVRNHYGKATPRVLGVQRFGKFYEAESVPRLFYTAKSTDLDCDEYHSEAGILSRARTLTNN